MCSVGTFEKKSEEMRKRNKIETNCDIIGEMWRFSDSKIPTSGWLSLKCLLIANSSWLSIHKLARIVHLDSQRTFLSVFFPIGSIWNVQEMEVLCSNDVNSILLVSCMFGTCYINICKMSSIVRSRFRDLCAVSIEREKAFTCRCQFISEHWPLPLWCFFYFALWWDLILICFGNQPSPSLTRLWTHSVEVSK